MIERLTPIYRHSEDDEEQLAKIEDKINEIIQWCNDHETYTMPDIEQK